MAIAPQIATDPDRHHILQKTMTRSLRARFSRTADDLPKIVA
jgi:hypothetical protein